jgi:hypothetical protein
MEDSVKVDGEWGESSIKVLSPLQAYFEPPTQCENGRENATYHAIR